MGDEPKELDVENPEEQKPSRRSLFYQIIGVLLVLGLIYAYGVRQALFYRRTPLGTPQEAAESIFDAEEITVPLRVFVFENSENFGSGRSFDDITQIVGNASDIWNQADINFDIEQTTFLDVSDEDIRSFFSDPYEFASRLEGYDLGAINVFFSKVIVDRPGISGIAFTGIRIVAVADLTTVYDFRVLAHEIGHIFGLAHTDSDKSRLMYINANSFDITKEEVLTAREEASKF